MVRAKILRVVTTHTCYISVPENYDHKSGDAYEDVTDVADSMNGNSEGEWDTEIEVDGYEEFDSEDDLDIS